MGKNFLIIGGSRGLGAIFTTTSAIHGANVTFSYNQSKEEADRIQTDLNNHRLLTNSISYDIHSPKELENTKSVLSSLDAVFYFATPPLSYNFNQWDETLYQKYRSYYVDGMKNLISSLANFTTEKPVQFFMPSTVAIEENTDGLGEYIKAKTEAEEILYRLSKTRNIRPSIHRLPLLPTDLTNRPNIIFSDDPINVCSDILKNF